MNWYKKAQTKSWTDLWLESIPKQKETPSNIRIFSTGKFASGDDKYLVLIGNQSWLMNQNALDPLGHNYYIAFCESYDDGSEWDFHYLNNTITDPYEPHALFPPIASNGEDVCVAWRDNRSGSTEIYVDHGTHR